MLYSFEVVILNTEMFTYILGPFSQLSQTLVHIPHGRPLGPVERFHGNSGLFYHADERFLGHWRFTSPSWDLVKTDLVS